MWCVWSPLKGMASLRQSLRPQILLPREPERFDLPPGCEALERRRLKAARVVAGSITMNPTNDPTATATNSAA